MKESVQLYKKIYDIAHSLERQGQFYTRADLAFELKEFGIKRDSHELNLIVRNAYMHYDNDSAIKNVFKDNSLVDSLVSLGDIEDMMEHGDTSALFPVLHDRLKKGDDTLEALEKLIPVAVGGVRKQSGGDTGIMSILVGSKGVADVQKEASDIFSRYSEMVGGYEDAKVQVMSLVSDFMMLRAQICEIYRRYSMMLVDVFGDSIKSVEPQLFDFNRIEWLDTAGMLKDIKLEYDKVIERCAALMSTISDNFGQSLKAASGAYRASGDKYTGLMVAGINMFSHYVGAAQMTTELKQDLQTLKNSVVHDVALVKGDLGRLTVIFKAINDVYIPTSEVFCRFADQVLTLELQQLEKLIYDKSEANQLKQGRDDVISKLKALEQDMSDEKVLIDLYSSRIKDNENALEAVSPQYDKAMAAKPLKPSGFVNVLTFGSSGKKYNRDIYEWDKSYGTLVSRYRNLQTDIKLDTDELNQQQAVWEKNKLEYVKQKSRLSRVNTKIMDVLSVDSDVKIALLDHLESIVKLLRLGRQIAESKLDDELVRKVTMEPVSVELPEPVKKNLQVFTDSVKEILVSDETCPDAPDIALLNDAENDAVRQVVNLVQECVKLNMLQEQSAVAKEAYDEELAKLQTKFKGYVSVLDKQTGSLLRSLKEINTAGNHDSLKRGLLSLAKDTDAVFKGSEWDEFLKGNKTIEL